MPRRPKDQQDEHVVQQHAGQADPGEKYDALNHVQNDGQHVVSNEPRLPAPRADEVADRRLHLLVLHPTRLVQRVPLRTELCRLERLHAVRQRLERGKLRAYEQQFLQRRRMPL